MEFHLALTVNQAMQKAILAHKAGRLKDARRFYELALKNEPLQPDANHNIGAIEMTKGHFHNAIPFLKIALDANPNNIQYWVSYIDALLNIEDYDSAGEWLKKVKEKGATGKIFDDFKLRLMTATGAISISQFIESFFSESKKAIFNNAAQGWYYSAFFNKEFMNEKSSAFYENSNANKKEIKRDKRSNTSKFKNSKEVLAYLNDEKNIAKKFNALKKITRSNENCLVTDSFKENTTLNTAGKSTFKEQGLNIAIIGAGVTGLFFANALKNNLGKEVNILLLDNRSTVQHIRESYKREWLTHIPSHTLQKYAPDHIQNLFECFGEGGLIGLQINMLEAILKLSCKEMGVQFYYAPTIEYSDLNHPSIDFFIDATGGRFNESDYSSTNSIKAKIALDELIGDFHYTGIVPDNRTHSAQENGFKVILKPTGDFHYPYINEANIHTPMIKITGVPEKLLHKVDDFIRPHNLENKFFLWKGALKSEFNEGLIFINLSNEEYNLLNTNINHTMPISTFLDDHDNILTSLSDDIVSFIKMLKELDQEKQIKIEKPFSYSPYINLNAGLGQLNGKPIYPIGDSYFTGNPKVGNGLWTHLGFINDLVRVISENQNKIRK